MAAPSFLTSISKPHARFVKLSLSIASLITLGACGGGGGSNYSTPIATVPDTVKPSNTLPSSDSLKNLCAAPRANSPDKQGTVEKEKAYLRSFVDETYLWYKEVPVLDPASYANPQKYFDDLKTSRKTASGRPVDEFHWSVTEESFNEQEAGISEGYGIEWARAASAPPRNWVVANLEPASPGGSVFKRGDKLKSVDGEDFENGSNINVLNEGLFPNNLNPHTFEVVRGSQVLKFTIKPEIISTTPVRYAKVTATPTGNVGYLYFDDHISKAEPLLISAIQKLKADGAQDLVLDLRYNGGGLISIASRLAYMLGGSSTTGKTFDKLVYNDKRSVDNYDFPFYNYASQDNGGAALPTLNLKRVYVLAGKGTASASEAIINGLRGVDVEVILIGETTRGKPYGFVPQDNCGWVYYTVQFKGENAKGFGDFADGFAPTCTVKDDFTKELGDVTEGRFAAALKYRDTKQCAAPSGMKPAPAPDYVVTSNPSKFLLIPR